MGYTDHAFARIHNASGVRLEKVTLSHQYSDDPDEGASLPPLDPGETSHAMRVGFNTGFIRTGQDYWWVRYSLPDGSTWVCPGKLKETLHPEDAGTTKTFTITGSMFTGFAGGIMQLHLEASPHYNAWAAVVLRNRFPVAASVALTHKYSDDRSYEHRFAPVPAGGSSGPDVFIVYFNIGFIRTGSDYWNLSVQLDVPPYDNAPATAFAAFKNATRDKACMLMSIDNGCAHEFGLDGDGVSLGLRSGACHDSWHTWNGYNTLGFVRVKNDFATTITRLVLTHQYSDDTAWRQTRALIPTGGHGRWMVVEFNTGFIRTGLDYWNVYVYTEDGRWYQNHKKDKECLLGTKDAVDPSTFTVSADTFTLGLSSGACTDSMDSKGTFSPTAGRDPALSYSHNAFIGSHNAYANFANGFWYAQQSGSVTTQLGCGATTLLLDIWYDDGDIYLKHEDAGILQPFVANRKLSQTLSEVREFLALQSRDPVTIVLEDRVEAAHQDLVKRAFVTSGTWGMVFNPDTYDVARRGWPRLEGLLKAGRPIVVLTSNKSSPDFAYQWSYMSENVYGDESLDQATWLQPRSCSQDLDRLGLCALNHFPTWSISSFTLARWIARAKTDNAAELVKTMIDGCHAQWGRHPNYINADFWEIPPDGMIEAIIYLNQRLHGATPQVLRVQHGQAILTDVDHNRLLAGDWARATRWVDEHAEKICPPIDPQQPGPVVHQLVDAINLTLVACTLTSLTPDDDTVVQPWLRATLGRLAGYFLQIEPLLDTNQGQGANQLAVIPYHLLHSYLGTGFQHDHAQADAPSLTGPAGHDQLLLAALTGSTDAVDQLTQRLADTLGEVAEEARTSRLYDLTHEILYLYLAAPQQVPARDVLGQLENLVSDTMPTNVDLGAELLAAYWAQGGDATAPIRRAVRQLKRASDSQLECQPDTGDPCSTFKAQVHNRLTLVLGVGATLATHGEVLDTDNLDS